MLLHIFCLLSFTHLLVCTSSLSVRLQGLTPVGGLAHVGGSQSSLSRHKPVLPVNVVKPNVVKSQGTQYVVGVVVGVGVVVVYVVQVGSAATVEQINSETALTEATRLLKSVTLKTREVSFPAIWRSSDWSKFPTPIVKTSTPLSRSSFAGMAGCNGHPFDGP